MPVILRMFHIFYLFRFINFQDFLSHRKEFIVISIRWDTDVHQGGNDNFFKNGNLLNELFSENRGNVWDVPVKKESKIKQKLFI